LTVKGNTDSVSFSLPIDILPKLKRFGIITTIKNGLLFIDIKEQANKELLSSFNYGDCHYYRYLAKIKSHKTGLEYNLSQHSKAKDITITFKGLHQYSKLSKTMEKDYKAFIELFHNNIIALSRVDTAIDSITRPNIRTIAANIKRTPFKYKKTTYFKTAKEKKTNQHLDIKHYHKKTPHITTHRIELCFKGRYLTGSTNKIEETIQKTVNKAFGYPVEIDFGLLNYYLDHKTNNTALSRLINKTILLKPSKWLSKAIKHIKQSIKQLKSFIGLIIRHIRR
jgi:hypothetical protein